MAQLESLPTDQNGNVLPAITFAGEPVMVTAPNGTPSAAQYLDAGLYLLSAAAGVFIKVGADDTVVASDEDFNLYLYGLATLLNIEPGKQWMSIQGQASEVMVSVQRCK